MFPVARGGRLSGGYPSPSAVLIPLEFNPQATGLGNDGCGDPVVTVNAMVYRSPEAFGFGIEADGIWRNAESASRYRAGSQAERCRACTVFLSEPIITQRVGFSRNSDRSSDRIGIKQQLANKDENNN